MNEIGFENVVMNTQEADVIVYSHKLYVFKYVLL